MQKRLLYNLRSNHLENKVTLLDCALTKEKRMVNIIESSTNLGETKVAKSGNENLVQGHSLQEIIESNSITNFQVLKIDIEGEEERDRERKKKKKYQLFSKPPQKKLGHKQ